MWPTHRLSFFAGLADCVTPYVSYFAAGLELLQPMVMVMRLSLGWVPKECVSEKGGTEKI